MSIIRTGLGSILFAIGIDNPELNTIKPAAGLDVILNNPTPAYAPRADAEPMPVIAGESHASSPQGEYWAIGVFLYVIRGECTCPEL